MKIGSLVLATSFLVLAACSTSQITPERVPASKDSFQLDPKQGGVELLQVLLKADPALVVKDDMVSTGEVNCIEGTSSMSPPACVFYANPSMPSRVTYQEAQTLTQWLNNWKKKFFPKEKVNDVKVNNIMCDGQGRCEISMGGSGHGVSVGGTDTTTKTIFVSVTGDKKIADKIYTALQSKQCFTLQDIDPRAMATSECHSFKIYDAKAKLDKNSPWYKVTAKAPVGTKPGNFSLQGYKAGKGEKMVRDFNPGKFQIPSQREIASAEADYSEEQYVKDVAKNIVALSFK